MYYPMFLLLILYVVAPAALIWLTRRTLPLWFIYPSLAVIFSNLGLIFINKFCSGVGLALSAFVCFLLVMLFTARLPLILRGLFALFMIAFAIGAGMMLGDATEFRVRDFSDDFSGALLGAGASALLFFLLYLRGGLKVRRQV